MNIKEKITKDDIWLKEPQAQDFPAALDYLELLFEQEECKKLVKRLKATNTI